MKSEHMHISITKEQKAMLQESADTDGRSMNAYIGQLIEKDYNDLYKRYLKSSHDPRD